MSTLKTALVILVFFSSCLLFSSETKTIAFAQDTLANDFRKAQVYEVRDAIAKHKNLKFLYSDANGRTALLISQIQKFIDLKVNLLIIGTNDADAIVPVVSKAYKSSIPVIILDRGITGDDYTTFINSDNIKIGKIGAEFIAKQLRGKGRVLLFEGLQQADVTKLRSKGFLDEISKHQGIHVIKRTGNYLRKDSIIEMERLIKENIRIDAIFAESDSMLSGARTAMQRHNLDYSSMITVGCDYTSEAREAIRQMKQTASVKFPLGGKQSVDLAIKILANEEVPKHIYIPVELVTKENLEDVEPIF
ncbi:substrate-binding domain-containing protein [bacterium]|nr:substrate-binding domain-containing protein [bacterium]MBU1991010.1 substrate-binding domain-containing protein [bacterium]